MHIFSGSFLNKIQNKQPNNPAKYEIKLLAKNFARELSVKSRKESLIFPGQLRMRVEIGG